MKRIALFLCLAGAVPGQTLRPPATPLITHDPYFSIWSMADRLTDAPTRHWTGADHPLAGIARIDGKGYRFLGSWIRQGPAMKQVSSEVTPTRTIYRFEQDGVRVTMTFLTPAFPEDLDLLSRPATYLIWDVRAVDGREHEVSLYFDSSALLAVNAPEQRMVVSRVRFGKLEALRAGSVEQPVLQKAGDNLRIDWGYLYLAAPPQPGARTALATFALRADFTNSGAWPENDETEQPAQTSRNYLVLAARFDLDKVGAAPVTRWAVLAYDDVFSIQLFHRNLRPYWRRKGATPADLLQAAVRDFPALTGRARRFDEELAADLKRAGGDRYAQIAILSYRQALAAHKLAADLDNTPLYFSKENFSNGCIATVDVTYPSAPLFLLMNPALLKGMMTPVFDYARLPRWQWPYAPHDLGTYPLANGQVYGGGEKTEERQMPVEESGNMLILSAAIAKAEGNAEYARRYWPLLTKWAEYLREKGMDPENQLSTDDFAGHLARNANLSIKAIVALGAYGQLARMLGRAGEAGTYARLAEDYAKKWVEMAADGDHYALAFGQKGSWSQKYNLVWDRLLDLHLFPPEVARKEVAFYQRVQNKYGLPLDNRETYTKLDWILWSATLAGRSEDFEALIEPVFRFLNESPSRVPMTDWYWTLDARQRGFQARSVVGGVFIKMLPEEGLWKKWAARVPTAP
ncbi:MAG: DUF4965 domain-containing protein [Acidobacteria bacterium]|nr:DUF4965 domain-containing protein [Acidobacteriota bacterium]